MKNIYYGDAGMDAHILCTEFARKSQAEVGAAAEPERSTAVLHTRSLGVDSDSDMQPCWNRHSAARALVGLLLSGV